MRRHYALSLCVARGAHQLRAYKDEYEVARLFSDPAFMLAVDNEVPDAGNLTYKLHPPILKALGRKSKISLRSNRSRAALRALAKGRTLRGTPLDPFGHTRMRRLERALSAHYETMVLELVATLTAAPTIERCPQPNPSIASAGMRRSKPRTYNAILLNWMLSQSILNRSKRCCDIDGGRRWIRVGRCRAPVGQADGTARAVQQAIYGARSTRTVRATSIKGTSRRG